MTVGEQAAKRAAANEKATRRRITRILPLLSGEDRRKIAYINSQLDRPDREDDDLKLLRSVRVALTKRYMKEDAT